MVLAVEGLQVGSGWICTRIQNRAARFCIMLIRIPALLRRHLCSFTTRISVCLASHRNLYLVFIICSGTSFKIY